MLAEIVLGFFKATLESGLGGMCNMNLGSHYRLVTSKKTWVMVHELLYTLIPKARHHGHIRTMV